MLRKNTGERTNDVNIFTGFVCWLWEGILPTGLDDGHKSGFASSEVGYPEQASWYCVNDIVYGIIFAKNGNLFVYWFRLKFYAAWGRGGRSWGKTFHPSVREHLIDMQMNCFWSLWTITEDNRWQGMKLGQFLHRIFVRNWNNFFLDKEKKNRNCSFVWPSFLLWDYFLNQPWYRMTWHFKSCT